MGRGRMKKILWKLLGGLFLVAVFVLVGLVSWMAFRAYSMVSEQNLLWKQTEQELLAKGESLSVDDFIPPEIPDERNFFADPLWEDLSDRVPVEWAGTTVMKNHVPKEVRRTHDLRRPFNEVECAKLEKAFPEFTLVDGSKTAEQVASGIWEREENAGPDKRRRAAEFILAAMAHVEPILSRVDDLAERPEARFPISYHDGVAMGLEHIAPLIATVRWWRLYGWAALELSNPRKAAKDALRILRLAEVLQNEPVLISVLSSASMNLQAVELINGGIVRHAWRAEDLRGFERNLSVIDLIPGLARSLRFERPSFNSSIETLLRRANNKDLQDALGWGEDAPLSRVGPYAGGLDSKPNHPNSCRLRLGGFPAGRRRLGLEWVVGASAPSPGQIRGLHERYPRGHGPNMLTA